MKNSDCGIPVFVVSLPDASERRLRIVNHFARIGVQFEFVDGICGKDLSTEERHKVASGTMQSQMGAIGCALSHFSIYEHMVEEEIECALIVEDDVVLDERVVELLHCNVVPAQDYLFLSCGTLGLSRTAGETIVGYDVDTRRDIAKGLVAAQLSHGPYRTHAYTISLSAATKRLSEAYPLTFPLDYYHHLKNQYVFEAILTPRLAWLSPLGNISQIPERLGVEGTVSPVIQMLKKHKRYFPIKDVLTLRRIRERRMLRSLVTSGMLPRKRWDSLPFGDGEILYADV